jgi:hypothetical protein
MNKSFISWIVFERVAGVRRSQPPKLTYLPTPYTPKIAAKQWCPWYRELDTPTQKRDTQGIKKKQVG